MLSIVIFAALLMMPATGLAARGKPSDAFPPERIVDKVEHYAVVGTSIRAINAALVKQASELELAGNGFTRSLFEIDRSEHRLAARCELSSLQVQVTILTILPQLQSESTVSAAVLEQWRHATGVLKRHEAGHRKHAIAEAQRLRRNLLALGSKRSCISLDVAMDLELQTSVERLNRKDARYDIRTWNGLRDDPSSPRATTLTPEVQSRQPSRWPDQKIRDFFKQ
ncbi:MAG TPA: DUF922 domain-containing protein [Dokdonella sp.]|uniref:DUF922 domain-containing protein n=1 Tax=Dokdonella sp. TaxID=2291710 RepID=UPI002D809AB0|nr:DUF922 domain-containing protein [Dokdonella sp.]HET9033396.1 DUF922 domain-containing protein [Dokdonella sp.]